MRYLSKRYMQSKIIHYCWFGRGKKTSLAEKCIDSWHRFLPDYDIKEWNEDNFDVNIIPYTKQAYEAKKYAFVSDYARFWILYHYGGLYFDLDVEIIRSMNTVLEKGPFFACENDEGVYPFDLVNPGLGIGSEKGMPIYKEILDYYANESFLMSDKKQNLETVVVRVTSILKKHGFSSSKTIQNIAGVVIYPHDYMCPIRIIDGKMIITENTVSIHHYAASWNSPTHRFLRKLFLKLGGVYIKKILIKFKN